MWNRFEKAVYQCLQPTAELLNRTTSPLQWAILLNSSCIDAVTAALPSRRPTSRPVPSSYRRSGRKAWSPTRRRSSTRPGSLRRDCADTSTPVLSSQATQRLGVVHAGDLPRELGCLRGRPGSHGAASTSSVTAR
jgi:hypothetical protein